jgi:hypothetical protein
MLLYAAAKAQRRGARGGKNAPLDLLGTHRPAEQEALSRIASQLAQLLLLLRVLDALGYGPQGQQLRERDDRAHERGIL